MPVPETAQDLREAIDSNPDFANTLQQFITDPANDKAPWQLNVRSAFNKPALEGYYKTVNEDMTAASGIAPKEGEFSKDYVKRVYTEGISSRDAQIQQLTAALDEAKKAGGTATEQAQLIEQLKGELKKKDTEFTTYKETAVKEQQAAIVNSDIEVGLAAARLQYNKDYPAELVQALENQVRNDLMKTAKIQQDGTLTYLDADGNPLLDSKKDYKPVKAEALIKERMKSVLVGEERTQTGGGTQGSGFDTGVDNADKKKIRIPTTVKNRQQLGDYLKTQGLVEGSADFNKAYAKAQESLKLPLN